MLGDQRWSLLILGCRDLKFVWSYFIFIFSLFESSLSYVPQRKSVSWSTVSYIPVISIQGLLHAGKRWGKWTFSDSVVNRCSKTDSWMWPSGVYLPLLQKQHILTPGPYPNCSRYLPTSGCVFSTLIKRILFIYLEINIFIVIAVFPLPFWCPFFCRWKTLLCGIRGDGSRQSCGCAFPWRLGLFFLQQRCSGLGLDGLQQ